MSRRILFIALIFSMVLSGCSVERKMAMQFVYQSPEVSVLIDMPEYVFKFNERDDKSYKGLRNLNQYQQDSALVHQTFALKDVDESMFVNIFESVFVSTLKKYEVKVYDYSQIADFQKNEGISWVVKIPQIELREFVGIREESEYYYGEEYSAAVPYTGINIAVWEEMIFGNNPEKEPVQVMFSEKEIVENLSGGFVFDQEKNEIYFSYDLDSLTPQHVYNFTTFLGRLYAGYTYDYLMNSYIINNIPKDKTPSAYFRFDPFSRRIYKTSSEDKFISLE